MERDKQPYLLYAPVAYVVEQWSEEPRKLIQTQPAAPSICLCSSDGRAHDF